MYVFKFIQPYSTIQVYTIIHMSYLNNESVKSIDVQGD